ncbi:SH3 domain-containing protein [Pseudalkalibacillus salsuginis]|uniref:SH3 domain-containing protein n=1 Tax=Pseudalkalibacillus salsuginis TaxID=2910972 RepID=UPI001F323D3B|nr:SH3 domain-containing protein [Pseudalkalibacillus salsuginis]MCF6408625.1 SH3 domain-containing protein [Pseudalkalibacillus salsuginis]
MKRFWNVFIVSWLVFGAVTPAFTSSVSAANQGYVKINVDTLNVRSGPGLDNSVVAQVHKNKEYLILSEKGEWLQIQVGNKKGWIAGWFARKVNKSSNESTGSPTDQWVSSIVDGLNVRSGPDTSFSILGQIHSHEKYQAIETKESWTKIRYKNSTGWLASWLTESANKRSTKQNPTSTGQSVVNIPNLNVRSGPGTNYNVIGSISKGHGVEILNIQNGWYEIKLKQGKGWVAGKYVTKALNPGRSSGTPSAPPASSLAAKAKVTAKILNVRDKATLNGKVVGQVMKDSEVKIVKKEHDWAYIEYGNKKGWVASWFLEELKSSTTPSTERNLSNNPSVSLLYDGTNLRNGPSTSHKAVARGNKGDQFPVLSKQGDWYKIKLSKQQEAYVAGWIVSLSGTSMPEVTHPTVGDHLKGKTIVLDSGHGGYDGGAVGITYGTIERDLNLSVAKTVSSKLQAAGAKVVMTRNDHQFVSLPFRVYLSHSNSADAFISLHFNSSIFPSAKGINSFYYSKSKDAPLASSLQDELVRQTGLSNRGVAHGDFQVLRNNRQPAVLLELGFLSNSQEEHYLRTATYKDKAGHAIYRGLAKYFSSK